MNANLTRSRRLRLASRRLRLASIFILALLVLSGLVFATPQGRVWAQSLLRFFTRAGSDTLPVQTWQLTPIPTTVGTATPDPANIIDANQTVAEVEQQAGFDVLDPGWLPGNLTFVGATLEPKFHIARIFYQYVETNGLVLREQPLQPTKDCELCGEVGASAAIETLPIGSVSGEYVEGVWKMAAAGPVWESDPYLKTLRWQANGMAFELVYMGPPDSVTKADLVAIAESMK